MNKWIRLAGLSLDVSIGIHAHERTGPQPYRLDIGLLVCAGYWAINDDIREAVDYDALRDRVTRHLQGRHFNLQETAVQDVVGICFGLDERIVEVDIAASKTAIYKDCDAVGLHYLLTRSDWMSSPLSGRKV